MKISIKGLIIFTILFLACFGIDAFAEKGDQFKKDPTLNKGKKWHVAYWQSGPWLTYTPRLYGFVEELMALGWIEKAVLPPPKDNNDAKTLWEWLSKDAKSKYLDFSLDNFYDANFDKVLRPTQKPGILEKGKKGQIDVIIAAGTDTAKELINADNTIPTLIMSVSDAVKSGISKSIDDSGLDHINAGVSPKRYLRQLQLFHQILKFKKLGIIYEDTDNGKTYAALETAQSLAKEKGFELISCTNNMDTNPDKKLAEEAYLKCLKEILPKIDAMYVTAATALGARIVEIQSAFNKAKIPTFSQLGTDQVKYGLLMSIAQTTRKFEGKKVAQKMAQVFNGAKPRELDQEVDEPQRIAINMKTAELIGFEVPIDTLEIVDETYKTIEVPPPPKS